MLALLKEWVGVAINWQAGRQEHKEKIKTLKYNLQLLASVLCGIILDHTYAIQ